MTVLEIMKMNKEYCLRYDEIPNELQIKAKTLCWEYNQCSPMEDEKRKERSDSGGASGENPWDSAESWTGF